MRRLPPLIPLLSEGCTSFFPSFALLLTQGSAGVIQLGFKANWLASLHLILINYAACWVANPLSESVKLQTQVLINAKPKCSLAAEWTASFGSYTINEKIFREVVTAWICVEDLDSLKWFVPIGQNPGSLQRTASTSGSRRDFNTFKLCAAAAIFCCFLDINGGFHWSIADAAPSLLRMGNNW